MAEYVENHRGEPEDATRAAWSTNKGAAEGLDGFAREDIVALPVESLWKLMEIMANGWIAHHVSGLIFGGQMSAFGKVYADPENGILKTTTRTIISQSLLARTAGKLTNQMN